MKKIPFLKDGCVFKQVEDTTKGTEFKGAKIPLIEDGSIVGYTTLEEAEAEEVQGIPNFYFKFLPSEDTKGNIVSSSFFTCYITIKPKTATNFEVTLDSSNTTGKVCYGKCNATKDCYFVGNAWMCGTKTTTITSEDGYITFVTAQSAFNMKNVEINTSDSAYNSIGIETDVVIGGTRYVGDGFIRVKFYPDGSYKGYNVVAISFAIKTTCEGIKQNEVNLKGQTVEFYLPDNATSYKILDIPVSYS